MFVPFFFQIMRTDFECPTCMLLPFSFFQIGMYTDEALASVAAGCRSWTRQRVQKRPRPLDPRNQ